jgi:hypothetical protein
LVAVERRNLLPKVIKHPGSSEWHFGAIGTFVAGERCEGEGKNLFGAFSKLKKYVSRECSAKQCTEQPVNQCTSHTLTFEATIQVNCRKLGFPGVQSPVILVDKYR